MDDVNSKLNIADNSTLNAETNQTSYVANVGNDSTSSPEFHLSSDISP